MAIIYKDICDMCGIEVNYYIHPCTMCGRKTCYDCLVRDKTWYRVQGGNLPLTLHCFSARCIVDTELKVLKKLSVKDLPLHINTVWVTPAINRLYRECLSTGTRLSQEIQVRF